MNEAAFLARTEVSADGCWVWIAALERAAGWVPTNAPEHKSIGPALAAYRALAGGDQPDRNQP